MSKSSVIRFVVAGVALILVLIPFHAFLTVWGSTLLGHYTLFRLWKELLLLPLGLAALWIALSDESLTQQILKSWLFKLLLAYFLLMVLLGLVALRQHTVDASALYQGLIDDLRLVTIFFTTWVVASYSPWLKDHWRPLLLIPATIVVVFGLLQAFVLPADFLSHFGYGPLTINPFQTVDQNSQFVRVQSTLRGSDPLGAYLVVILAAIAAFGAPLLLQYKKLKENSREILLWGLFGLAILVVLFCTFSRTAYVGALLAVAVVVWRTMPSKRVRNWLVIAALSGCVVFGGVAFALRHNPTFEDTFFHTSQLSKSKHSSNQNHVTALKNGAHDLLNQPFGLGPGSAGPASVHNNHPARISENYFIQVGQEAGWLGLVLFIAITALIAKKLWDKRYDADRLSIVMLSSLVGLIVVNLLLPAWTDDTLAYVWWGLAGVAVATVVVEPGKTKAGKAKG